MRRSKCPSKLATRRRKNICRACVFSRYQLSRKAKAIERDRREHMYRGLCLSIHIQTIIYSISFRGELLRNSLRVRTFALACTALSRGHFTLHAVALRYSEFPVPRIINSTRRSAGCRPSPCTPCIISARTHALTRAHSSLRVFPLCALPSAPLTVPGRGSYIRDLETVLHRNP